MLTQGIIYAQQVFVDPTFNAQASLNGVVWASQIQSDGKILVGGEFTSFSGTSTNRIVRLNPNGTFDNSFITGAGFNDIVWAIAIQSDGKILVGGQFTNYNGVIVDKLVRLHPTGLLDATFTPPSLPGPSFPGASVRTILPESNGDILVGGVINARILRLNPNGALNTGFSFISNQLTSVLDIEKLSDGRILVAGGVSSFNKSVFRLLPTGVNDPTFVCDASISNAGARTISLQSDGKIIVGGDFTFTSGNGYIARLMPNGTRDLSFVVGTGTNANVWTSNVFPNGDILIGGVFTSYNGNSPQRNLTVLDRNNGGLSTNYNFGNGFAFTGSGNSGVLSSIIQPDGKILAFGQFTSFNGENRTNLVRLTTQCIPPTISSQPSGASVCAGTSHLFSVTASGTALQFVWKRNSQTISQSNSFLYNATLPGNYTVDVFNSCGSVTSVQATLTSIANSPPSQPSCALRSDGICVNTLGERLTTLSWQPGGGNNQLVVASLNPITNFPVSGNQYSANAIFGFGSDLGNFNYVVYKGNLNSIIPVIYAIPLFTGKLHYAVFEYNDCGSPQYLTRSYASGYIDATDPVTTCTELPPRPESSNSITIKSNSLAFQVFPNPSGGTFTIEVNQQDSEQKVQYKVMSVSGRTEESGYFSGSKHQIDLKGKGAGLYILELTQGSKVHIQKLVIE